MSPDVLVYSWPSSVVVTVCVSWRVPLVTTASLWRVSLGNIDSPVLARTLIFPSAITIPLVSSVALAYLSISLLRSAPSTIAIPLVPSVARVYLLVYLIS